MVANPETINPSSVDMALDLMGRMEALAADSEWNRTEGLAVRLKSAILDIPESERHAVIVTIGHRLEQVRTKALVSRGEVTGKLSDIRRGQVATRAYGQPQGAGSTALLR